MNGEQETKDSKINMIRILPLHSNIIFELYIIHWLLYCQYRLLFVDFLDKHLPAMFDLPLEIEMILGLHAQRVARMMQLPDHYAHAHLRCLHVLQHGPEHNLQLYTKGTGVFGALGHGDALLDAEQFKKVPLPPTVSGVKVCLQDGATLRPPQTIGYWCLGDRTISAA